MTNLLYGYGVSAGITIGYAKVIRQGEIDIPEHLISKKEVEQEILRLEQAINAAKAELRSIRETISSSMPGDVSSFIDTHILMLEDGALASEPKHLILTHYHNAAYALKIQRDELAKAFSKASNPYLKSRLDDVDIIFNLILRFLLKEEPVLKERLKDKENLSDNILIANELSPSDVIFIQNQGIKGIIWDEGTLFSHVGILARSLDIPVVLHVRDASRFIKDEESLIIDGERGVIIVNPEKQTVSFYQEKQKTQKREKHNLLKIKKLPCQTIDEKRVRLTTNCELIKDFDATYHGGAEGVGLYRTETLYMNRSDYPSEEEHYQNYTQALKKLHDLPITIRLVDIGADKIVSSAEHLGNTLNPALGLRGIRFALNQPVMLKSQLRGILRASIHGHIRILIPMICQVQEILQTRELLEKTKAELTFAEIPYDNKIELGGMIETPAAAICIESFIEHLDFIAIGTNDLVQYTLAVDRADDAVSYLYNTLHPAVINLIKQTITASIGKNIPVSVCGEFAGNQPFVEQLLMLGVREFSVHPTELLHLKKIIRESNISRLLLQNK